MRAHRVGVRGLLVDCPATDRVHDLYAEILRRRDAGDLPPIVDVVPGARSVLLDGIEGVGAVDRLAAEIKGWEISPGHRDADRLVELPTVYDGDDLTEVADLVHLTVNELVERHSEAVYTVQFCGFMPGFGYLTGLPESLQVPRRATPRTFVPPGSVAVAGEFTGVYPRGSPGGWRLLGRTDVVLWDPEREPAALLSPGTRVRFRRLSA